MPRCQCFDRGGIRIRIINNPTSMNNIVRVFLLTEGKLRRCGPPLIAASVLIYAVLAFFAHPSADDYGLMVELRDRGFCGMQAYYYLNVGGRLSAFAVVASFWWLLGLEHYWILPLLMLGLFYLVVRLFGKAVLPAEFWREHHLLWPLAFLALFLAGMPSRVEGFYWFCGAVPYLMGPLIGLALFACLMRLSTPEQPIAASTSWGARLTPLGIIFLSFLATGFVEPLTGAVLLLLVVGAVLAHLNDPPSRRIWLLALLAAAAGTALNVSAPGNYARSSYFAERHQFWFSVCASYEFVFHYALRWLRQPLLVVALLAFLSASCQAVIAGKLRMRQAVLFCWIIWPITVFILVGGVFCHFWATGNPPPKRVSNLLYLFFLTAWFLFLACLACSMATSGPLRRIQAVLASGFLRRASAALFVVLLLSRSSTVNAVSDLFRRAPAYHREIKQREALIRDAVARNETGLRLPPLSVRPRTLYFMDIFPNPTDTDLEAHWNYAKYWGLKSITLLQDAKHKSRYPICSPQP